MCRVKTDSGKTKQETHPMFFLLDLGMVAAGLCAIVLISAGDSGELPAVYGHAGLLATVTITSFTSVLRLFAIADHKKRHPKR